MKLIYILFACITFHNAAGQSLKEKYPEMADRIIQSLKPSIDENVIIRYDPDLMRELSIELNDAIQTRVNSVELWPYGPVEDFESKLDQTDIYIWMPVRRSVQQPGNQVDALIKWLDDGMGRQIHFHWGDGTRNWDSSHGLHNEVYDSVYFSALNIDYEELDRRQTKAIEILKSGEVAVTTPAGTDLSFLIGDRTITRQNGDASADRMKTAKVRIEREIELPAGVIRVAPIEESINGTLVIGTGTVAGVKVKDLRLTFENGRITSVKASAGLSQFKKKLEDQGALNYFREIGIGFNPNLRFPNGYDYVPYYGYGAGVVRLSLGNNIEVGGVVSGSGVQWMFFLDATVRTEGVDIVKKGRLVIN